MTPRTNMTVFRRLLDQLTAAKSVEELNAIFYAPDGIDMSFQHEKLTWEDFERLSKMHSRLCELIEG